MNTAELLALPTDWRLARVGPNKRPIAGERWFDVDNFTPDEAASLRGRPPAAWGLKSGPCSGVVVLDLDAQGWAESFREVTGHSVEDLPPTISWTSGKQGRSGRAFAVDPDWWPSLGNRRQWANAQGETCWELRGDRHQAVIIGKHPETGSYRWLEGCSPHEIPEPASAPDWLLEAMVIQEHPDAKPVEVTAEDANRAQEMLKAIPAADFTTYGKWLAIGMALHHTDPGLLSAWVDWCRPMSNFDEAECLTKWKSFGKRKGDRPVTIATLYYHAKENGYRNPRRPKEGAAGGAVHQSTASGQQQTEGSAGANGRALALKPNQVLERLPQRLGLLRLNVRTGDVHSSEEGILKGNQINRLYMRLSNPAEVWGKEATADGVILLASQNEFDPVADYLTTNSAEPLPMEQWQHLDRHLLGIEDPIAARFLPRFLISAVARVFEPGCYVRQVPVLVGPQERGKSALGEILFGSDYWVSGVNKLDREDLMRLQRAWGAELAELDGVSRRSDQEHLKAFLTAKADVYRTPYDRSPEEHKRRSVFWGTSNGAPLRDTTGSTRFVCISNPDRPLPLNWAKEHRDSLWARAMEQYLAGVSWIKASEEERQEFAERNANYQEIDPWGEPIAQYLNRAHLEQSLPVKMRDLLKHLEVPVERQTSAISKRARAIVEQLGWVHSRRRFGAGLQQQGFWPPVHPVHPSVQDVCTPTEASQANVSGCLCTPCTPIQEEGMEEGRGEGQLAINWPPVEAPGELLPSVGVHRVPPPKTDCAADALLCTPPCTEGVHRARIKPWEAEACKIRAEMPDLSPAQIALVLQQRGFPDITGRRIKQLFHEHPFPKTS